MCLLVCDKVPPPGLVYSQQSPKALNTVLEASAAHIPIIALSSLFKVSITGDAGFNMHMCIAAARADGENYLFMSIASSFTSVFIKFLFVSRVYIPSICANVSLHPSSIGISSSINKIPAFFSPLPFIPRLSFSSQPPFSC